MKDPKDLITPVDYINTVITLKDWQMGRHIKYETEYNKSIENNAKDLLQRVNSLLTDLGIEKAKVSSGWRPKAINKNAGGAKKSAHLVGKAIDIKDDENQSLSKKILENAHLLKDYGLWIEDPKYTKGKWTNWVHLDTVKRSDRKINKFIPY